MNPRKAAYLLVVFPLSAFLAGGCAGKTTQPAVKASSSGALTMRYADFIDQPHMTTLGELKDTLSLISPKQSWAWDGGSFTVEHGPDHKLIVTASPQCQELVANTLINQSMQDVQNNCERINALKLARLRATNQLPADPADSPLK